MENQSTPSMNDVAASWSEEDRDWLKKHVPEELQTIAVRHGRQLFSIVMQAGAATFALTTLNANIRHPQLSPMIATLTKIFDQFCQRAVKSVGCTVEQFHDCKNDIERLAALKDAGNRQPGERVSKGGIILDS